MENKVVVMAEKHTLKVRSGTAFASFVVSGVTLVLAACTAATQVAPIQTAPERPVVVRVTPRPTPQPVDLAIPGYIPAHMQDQSKLVRVGLLLPFSAESSAIRTEAVQILHAAELALFERAGGNMVLLPRDTVGDPRTARGAAEAVIADGADLIIGPLLPGAVATAAEKARNASVPMIAFSTDSAMTGEGVYQLSFPPDEEVRRVVEYAALQGATRYGFIGPATTYGQIAHTAYADAITDLLGETPPPETVVIAKPAPEDMTEEETAAFEPELVEMEFATGLVSTQFYDGGVLAMTEAATSLAALGVEELDPAEAAVMSGADWAPTPASAFQVLLLPEGGDQLRMLAPILLYQNIDPLLVKFLGTGLWRDKTLAREPALSNGWFAGPDLEARARFENVFARVYGAAPSRLASLGYDAAALAALLFDDSTGFDASRLDSEDGFFGVDGLFRFRRDGTIERGLAIYTIRGGQFRVLDPAPVRFGDPHGAPAEDVEPEEAF